MNRQHNSQLQSVFALWMLKQNILISLIFQERNFKILYEVFLPFLFSLIYPGKLNCTFSSLKYSCGFISLRVYNNKFYWYFNMNISMWWKEMKKGKLIIGTSIVRHSEFKDSPVDKLSHEYSGLQKYSSSYMSTITIHCLS